MSETRRFRASSTVAYSHALIVLTQHARTSGQDFEFGPVGSVQSIVNNGLAITGSEAVVQALAELLEQQVPGLYVSEELDVGWPAMLAWVQVQEAPEPRPASCHPDARGGEGTALRLGRRRRS